MWFNERQHLSKLNSCRFEQAQLYSCQRIFWIPSLHILPPELYPRTNVSPGVSLTRGNSTSQPPLPFVVSRVLTRSAASSHQGDSGCELEQIEFALTNPLICAHTRSPTHLSGAIGLGDSTICRTPDVHNCLVGALWTWCSWSNDFHRHCIPPMTKKKVIHLEVLTIASTTMNVQAGFRSDRQMALTSQCKILWQKNETQAKTLETWIWTIIINAVYMPIVLTLQESDWTS